MRALRIAAALLALAATRAQAKTVESFQFVMGNELDAEGSQPFLLENTAWVQKSWANFDRDVHTLALGTDYEMDSGIQPGTGYRMLGASDWGIDNFGVTFGYKFRTYLPDWYNLAIRLRVPVMVPNQADRKWSDRLELRADPLLVNKSWNLFTVWDRNRITAISHYLEYGNKLKLIRTVPDLNFPIAMYAGFDLRVRKYLDEDGGRMRNDFLVGIASNYSDWLHIAVDFMYRVDTKESTNNTFLAIAYMELYFDIFFDNTFGAAEKRQVHEEERD